MIDWKPEAIAAAKKELTIYDDRSADDDMRAALNAAVEAQGLEEYMREQALHYISAVGQAQENYARGRAEAFEEAAKELEACHLTPRSEIAAAFRALAKGQPK